MKIKFFITRRYLKGKSKFFLSTSNILSLLGIAIGVFALLLVSSVMSGFSSDMTNRVVETKGEIRFSRKDKKPIIDYKDISKLIKQNEEIAQLSPVVHCDLLLRRGDFTAYTQSVGIEFSEHKKVSTLLQRIKLGRPCQLSFGQKGIILGSELSYQLFATVGDSIDIISPAGAIMSPFGYLPKVDKAIVVGIFSTGLPEYDQSLSYISLDMAMDLKNQKGIDFFESTTHNFNKSGIITDKFNANKKIYTQDEDAEQNYLIAEHWSTIDHSLFQAIKIEKIAMFFVLSLMLILSGFNIMNNNIRIVSDRKFDISLLKSLGVSKKEMYSVVSIMGLFLGILGTIIGELLAAALIISQYYFKFIKIPIPGFPFTSLPVEIRWIDFLIFGLMAIIISYLSSVLPAKYSMHYDIIQVLREKE